MPSIPLVVKLCIINTDLLIKLRSSSNVFCSRHDIAEKNAHLAFINNQSLTHSLSLYVHDPVKYKYRSIICLMSCWLH